MVVDTWFILVIDMTCLRRDLFLFSVDGGFCGCLDKESATTLDFPETGTILKLKSTILSNQWTCRAESRS